MVIICVAIFLLVWGLGLFFVYLAGFKQIKLPPADSHPSGPAYLKDQQRITGESEDQRKRMMQDYQYQIQRYKDTIKTTPLPR